MYENSGEGRTLIHTQFEVIYLKSSQDEVHEFVSTINLVIFRIFFTFKSERFFCFVKL